MTPPTDDEVRALVEQLRQPWDGTAGCRERRTQAMHIAATMLSRLLAERAEARDEALEEAAKVADDEPLSGEPPAHFTAREVKCVEASYHVTKSSIAENIRALKSSPADTTGGEHE